MTLDQAIEILTTYMKGSDEAEPVDFDDSILLGIEALKRLQTDRQKIYCTSSIELPGETEGVSNDSK